MIFSASKSARAINCPGSFSLPQVEEDESEHAARGTVIHQFMENTRKLGRDAALAQVPDEHQTTCEVIDVDWLLSLNGRVLVEAGFSWNLGTGEARFHGERMKHGDVPDGDVTAILDLVIITGDEVVVIDYKTGRMVEKAQDNPQLLTGAALVEDAFGLNLPVSGCILYLWDGFSHFDRASWDALDLDAHRSVMIQTASRLQSKDATVRTGRWCRYCPAFSSCPAKVAMVRAAAEGKLQASFADALLHGKADLAVQTLVDLKSLVGALHSQLQSYVEGRGPIDMGSGNVWGPRTSKPREQLDGKAVYQMLKDSLGAEVALSAVSLESSKKALREALSPVAKSKGVPLAKLERDALEVLRKSGGVTLTNPSITYDVHPEHKE